MNATHVALLGCALSIAGAPEALACRDANKGKAVHFQELEKASSGPNLLHLSYGPRFRQTLNFGNSNDVRLHFCARLAFADPSDRTSLIGLYFWRGSDGWYDFEIFNGRFRVMRYLFSKEYPLTSWKDLPEPKGGPRRTFELDFQADQDGANVLIDGEPAASFIARPLREAGAEYGILLVTGDKAAAFDVIDMLDFGVK